MQETSWHSNSDEERIGTPERELSVIGGLSIGDETENWEGLANEEEGSEGNSDSRSA